ncbi:MAG: T9SS type A sorting domain-containing protein [Rubrivivax sp.]|jgi:hypothetical protein|nr:T9SS type A sorting domain-containing protein [Rubrivivax sp.]
MQITVISFISILIIFSNLHSQGIPYGKEFQVNTYTIDSQHRPVIAALLDGGFVVCWDSYNQDGSESGVFCQLFDASSAKEESEFQVNSRIKYSQVWSSVASLTDSGFVVCWASEGDDDRRYNIIGQLFSSLKVKKGNEFQVNTSVVSNHWMPCVAGLMNGGFVICWTDDRLDGSGLGIFGQLYDAVGSKLGNEFQANTQIYGDQDYVSVTGLKDSSFVICWESRRGSNKICGQIFEATGIRRGAEFQVDNYLNDYQSNPTTCALVDGGFVVCWSSLKQDGSAWGICGQIFDSRGAKQGNEFLVNTFTKNSQCFPSVAALNNGGFVVCWQSDGQDGSGYGIFGQVFDAKGLKKGKEFQVNTYITGFQEYSSVAGLKNGDFVICWQSFGQDGSKLGIFGKYFLDTPLIHELVNYSLIEPSNDLTLNITRPTFRWRQASTIQECYPWELIFDLYIDSTVDFSNPQIIKNIEDTTYTIDSLTAGKTYFWKVLAKNLAGDSLWSKQQDWGFFIKQGATLVENAEYELPQHFELFQNYPNPFNSSTTIKYQLPAATDVKLEIYNLLGQRIRILVDQSQLPDSYSIRWDGTDDVNQPVASGVYLYQLKTKSFVRTNKLVVLQ